MKKDTKTNVIDAGEAEREQFDPIDEVKEEFEEAQRLDSGREILRRELRLHHSRTPQLSGGDIDAAWDQADIGDETVGGSSPTPDQAIVEELGEAVGLIYEDGEPLKTSEKLAERDRKRWELDPASSDDYAYRVKNNSK